MIVKKITDRIFKGGRYSRQSQRFVRVRESAVIDESSLSKSINILSMALGYGLK